MHIGKSVKLALIHGDKDIKWLANQLERTEDTARHIRRNKKTSFENIEKLAKIFKMKVSEFIALGEDK
jgi:hypothetical protein